ncbi:WD40 repeat domain-containing protein, partial [Candidatus Poribacteria bacterium]|nr:WD40 repeat domain-containing protein [Candidatus Poribacteria bacterium]
MKFRILSIHKRRQRDVRNFGILLLVIGIASRDPGITPLSSLGAIMLLWSAMSWGLRIGIAKGKLQDTVWIHIIALITLILVDHQVNGILQITKSAITNFSKQALYAELSAPPKIPEPILELDHGDGIYALAFSPTDPDIIATTGNNTIKLWNQNTPETPEILHFKKHRDNIDALAFSPNGKYLAAGSPNAITLWDTQQKRTVQTFEDGANTITFSPDNRYLATAKWDLNLFDITDTDNFNKITLFEHRKHDVQIESLTFSPNGAYLFSGDNHGYVKVWNIEKQSLAIQPLKAGTGRVRDIKFLNDKMRSRFMTAGTEGSIKFWRATDYQVEHNISTGTVLNLACSPDGKTLLTAAWDKVNLWDIQTGTSIFSFKQAPRAVGFGPDAFTFATGDTDGKLRIWDSPI